MGRRIAFIVNAFAPDIAAHRDTPKMYTLLKDPSLGQCTTRPKMLDDCRSKRDFESELDDVLSEWDPADQLVFYFAGHGVYQNNQYANENDAFFVDKPRQMLLSHLVFANVFLKRHDGDVVLLGKELDVGHKGTCHLGHGASRGKDLAAMTAEKGGGSTAVLQLGLVHVEVHAIDAFDFQRYMQRYMLPDDICDTLR